MSVKTMGLAWYVGELSPAQKIVLLALADHSNDEGKSIYPGVKRLTYKTSLSERAVRRALSDLRKLGLIKVEKDATFHLPTEYSVDLPQMQAMQTRPPIGSDDLPEMHPLQLRPATQSVRPARNAPKPSLTIINTIEEEVELPPRPNVFKIYEQEIGPLTPHISDALIEAEKQYTEQWVIEAIHIASAYNARSWSYIQAILKRWIKDGFGSDTRKPEQKAGGQPRGLGAIQRAAAKKGIQLFPDEAKHGE